MPLLLRLRSLNYKSYVSFAFANHLTLTDLLRQLKLAFDKFANATRVKVKCMAITRFKLIFVKVVSIISHFSDFVTNFCELRVFVPMSQVLTITCIKVWVDSFLIALP